MSTKRKGVQSFKVKDAASGEVEVVFATLGVIDHDGDVLTKSSFDDGAPVVISAYGHRSHVGDLPIGRGTIVMSDDEAKMVGTFLMDTAHGRDAFATIKAMDELQEWSFSLRDVEEHTGKLNGQSANFIDHVTVKEVSPVLEGAGIDTRTVSIKGWKQAASQVERGIRSAAQERWGGDETYVWVEDWDPDKSTAVIDVYKDGEPDELWQVSFERDGNTVTLSDDAAQVQRVVEYVPKAASEPTTARKFVEHVKSVLTDVAALTDRATEVVTFRAEKGKQGLSSEAATVVADLDAHLDALRTVLTPTTSLSASSVSLIADLMEVEP